MSDKRNASKTPQIRVKAFRARPPHLESYCDAALEQACERIPLTGQSLGGRPVREKTHAGEYGD